MMIYVKNTSKRKKKPRGKGWKEREAAYLKQCKKLGIDPNAKPKKREFKPLTQSEEMSANHRRAMEHRDKYPSVDGFGSANACAKKEPNVYTGTLIKGIATMHKSNAVPVINEEQATDIARMRR